MASKTPAKRRPPPQPFSTQLRDLVRQVWPLLLTAEGRETLRHTRIVLQVPKPPDRDG